VGGGGVKNSKCRLVKYSFYPEQNEGNLFDLVQNPYGVIQLLEKKGMISMVFFNCFWGISFFFMKSGATLVGSPKIQLLLKTEVLATNVSFSQFGSSFHCLVVHLTR